MNRERARASWEQFKGRAKQAWGRLTEDDFLRARGSRTRLMSRIETRFGDTRDAIKAKLEQVRRDRADRNGPPDARG